MSTSHTSTFMIDMNEVQVDIFKLRRYSSCLPYKRVCLESLRGFIADTEENARWGEEKGRRFGPALVINRLWDNNVDQLVKEHIIRICEADLSFPIWIFRGQLIDGLHRLTKAFILEERDILVQEWLTIPDEAIIKGP